MSRFCETILILLKCEFFFFQTNWEKEFGCKVFIKLPTDGITCAIVHLSYWAQNPLQSSLIK